MKEYESYTKFIGAKFLKSLDDDIYSDGKRVTTVCLITAYSQKQLKNGNMLVSLTLEDISSSVQAVCFSAVYQKYKHLLSVGNILKVNAKISLREEAKKELIIEAVEVLPPFAANFVMPKPKNKVLYLKVKSIDSDCVEQVKGILSENKGETPVYIYDALAKKKYCAPENLWADISDTLIEALECVLGKENVKIVEN